MNKKLFILLSLLLALLLASCAKKPDKPVAEPTTAAPETSDAPVPDETAAPADWFGAGRTEFDHTVRDETIELTYVPLDANAHNDIYAACVSACTRSDDRFAQYGLSGEQSIRETDIFTSAYVTEVVTDGATGRAIAFMTVRYRADEEPMGARNEYFFVLRTDDYGKTWEISTTDFIFNFNLTTDIVFGERLYLFSYSEILIQQLCLYSDDWMDTCRIIHNDFDYMKIGYIRNAALSDDHETITLSVETTNHGFIGGKAAMPFTPTKYEVITDLQLNQLSVRQLDQ